MRRIDDMLTYREDNDDFAIIDIDNLVDTYLDEHDEHWEIHDDLVYDEIPMLTKQVDDLRQELLALGGGEPEYDDIAAEAKAISDSLSFARLAHERIKDALQNA